MQQKGPKAIGAPGSQTNRGYLDRSQHDTGTDERNESSGGSEERRADLNSCMTVVSLEELGLERCEVRRAI